MRFVCLECHANLPIVDRSKVHGRGAAGVSRFALAACFRTARCAIRRFTAATWIGTCSNEGAAVAFWAVLPLLAQQPAALRAGDTTRACHGTCTPPATRACGSSDAASPVPSTEPVLTGWIDLGYRWSTGVGGSFDTYRSIINLGSGPKLLGADFTLTDPKHKWFDTIQVRADSWGDEPSSSVHVEAKNPACTISTPTIATSPTSIFCPLTPTRCSAKASCWTSSPSIRGARLRRFRSTSGPAIGGLPTSDGITIRAPAPATTVFVTDGNNYPVPNTLRDSTNLYRARRPIRKAALPRHARRGRHDIQERPEPVSESRLDEFRQFLDARSSARLWI